MSLYVLARGLQFTPVRVQVARCHRVASTEALDYLVRHPGSRNAQLAESSDFRFSCTMSSRSDIFGSQLERSEHVFHL